jgi:DNA-binding NtrC family response regulator
MQLSTGAVEALMRRSWPGNVRQLRNLIDRLAVFAESDTVEAEDVARVSVAKIASAEQSLVRAARELLELPVKDKLAAMESALIAEALTRVEGNKSAAARLLGVHRKVIERRVGRGPDDDEDDGEP